MTKPRNSIYGISMVLLTVSCAQEQEIAQATVYPEILLQLSHMHTPPDTPDLAGQTWQAGATSFSFQKGFHVLFRGGPLRESMPTGAPGTYQLDDNALSLDVLGRTYSGIWDGTHLTINGQTATYLGQTALIYPDTVVH
jgi:hypothetical protein